ncbi:MAG: tRNA (N6-isopentenyl adenosine(37)-C2)-methylthiotransferase MiaB, partial [Clostridiales bacterium]|nr:tRNA (N6-isopentenyl adenosine(37)-C2)-methylthiotransferase MiaB [Clostridiales bacterium]
MSTAVTVITREQMREQRDLAAKVRRHPARPASYHIVTLGCQMNVHDSEKLAGMLRDMGLSEADTRGDAELVLFNTCCIRENAQRKALGNITWLKELKKAKPGLLIGVCGS